MRVLRHNNRASHLQTVKLLELPECPEQWEIQNDSNGLITRRVHALSIKMSEGARNERLVMRIRGLDVHFDAHEVTSSLTVIESP